MLMQTSYSSQAQKVYQLTLAFSQQLSTPNATQYQQAFEGFELTVSAGVSDA